MIYNYVENIFDLYPEAIAHPVNCIGLNHDILSKKIKKIWPDYFREYTRACLRKRLIPYRSYHYQINSLFGTNHIITMTIRNNWQERLKQETMRNTINSLIIHCHDHAISTIAIPMIESVPQKWVENEINIFSNKQNINKLCSVFFFQNS
jgi:hypothetical protein